MTDHFKINCPACGEPVVMRTADGSEAPDAKSFRPYPSKENRDKIFAEMESLSKSMKDGFSKIFDRDLWR